MSSDAGAELPPGQSPRQQAEGFAVLAVAEGFQDTSIEELLAVFLGQGGGEGTRLLLKAAVARVIQNGGNRFRPQPLVSAAAGLLPKRRTTEPSLQLFRPPGHPGSQSHHRHPSARGQTGVFPIVVPEDHMENDVVIGMVMMVSMAAKGAGQHVQLHIPSHPLAAKLDDGIAKVGAGTAGARTAAKDHAQGRSIAADQGLSGKALSLPQAHQLSLARGRDQGAGIRRLGPFVGRVRSLIIQGSPTQKRCAQSLSCPSFSSADP